MRHEYKFFRLSPLLIIGILLVACFGGSTAAALIFGWPVQSGLVLGLLAFLLLLIPVAFRLHRLSHLRN